MGDIRLERFAEAHLDAVSKLVLDDDIQRFTRVPVPPPPEFAAEWLAAYEQGRRDGTRAGFAIVDGDGTFLGLALAFDIDREAESVELGYAIAPEARGRGVASRALELLTEWAFTELQVRRIELRISTDNPASSRVAERAGYVREGLLRSVHFKGGLRKDQELWSRLPGDR